MKVRRSDRQSPLHTRGPGESLFVEPSPQQQVWVSPSGRVATTYRLIALVFISILNTILDISAGDRTPSQHQKSDTHSFLYFQKMQITWRLYSVATVD